MTKAQIEREARRLLDENGLTEWRIRWADLSRSGWLGLYNAAGQTWWDKPYIDLSIPFFAIATDAEQLDTLRHEIAHAIMNVENPIHPFPQSAPEHIMPWVGQGGHGVIWAHLAAAAGANPEPTITDVTLDARVRREGLMPTEATHQFMHPRPKQEEIWS